MELDFDYRLEVSLLTTHVNRFRAVELDWMGLASD